METEPSELKEYIRGNVLPQWVLCEDRKMKKKMPLTQTGALENVNTTLVKEYFITLLTLQTYIILFDIWVVNVVI